MQKLAVFEAFQAFELQEQLINQQIDEKKPKLRSYFDAPPADLIGDIGDKLLCHMARISWQAWRTA